MSETVVVEKPVSGHTARRLETRRRLLEAGTQLFAELGVQAATTTAIARRAGVGTGTFYLHFPDKHALFEVLVQDALDEMRSQLQPRRLSVRTDDDRRREIEGMLEVVERRRSLIRAVFDRGETTRLAERIQDRIAEGLEPIYAVELPARGTHVHPGATAHARAAVLVRVIAWWAEDLSRATRHDVVETLLEFDPLRERRRPIPEEYRT